MSGEELIGLIERASKELPRNDEMDLLSGRGVGAQGQTGDDLDLASRLARQVANKLIMEQLVQQLGDGGVPAERVDEIVRDILPQEFNTVQLDQQSDRVKRLANQLVLDKLRARLRR